MVLKSSVAVGELPVVEYKDELKVQEADRPARGFEGLSPAVHCSRTR